MEDVRTGPTPIPRLKLLAVMCISIAEGFAITMLFPFVGFMVKDFGGSRGDALDVGYRVGWIASAFFFAQAIASPFWGTASDVIGLRPSMLAGLLGNMIVMPMFGTSRSLTAAIMWRGLNGLLNGNNAIIKTYVRHISDETNQARCFSLMGLSWGISSIIGPAIGGLLSRPAVQYPSVFSGDGLFGAYPYLLPCLLSGLVNLIGLVAAWIAVKETVENPLGLAAFGSVLLAKVMRAVGLKDARSSKSLRPSKRSPKRRHGSTELAELGERGEGAEGEGAEGLLVESERGGGGDGDGDGHPTGGDGSGGGEQGGSSRGLSLFKSSTLRTLAPPLTGRGTYAALKGGSPHDEEDEGGRRAGSDDGSLDGNDDGGKGQLESGAGVAKGLRGGFLNGSGGRGPAAEAAGARAAATVPGEAVPLSLTSSSESGEREPGDESGSDGGGEERKVSMRAVLSEPLVMATIGGYALLCFQYIIMDETLSLWALTAREDNGLGFGTFELGLCNAVTGAALILWQGLVFHRIERILLPVRCFILGSVFSLVLFMTPFSANVENDSLRYATVLFFYLLKGFASTTSFTSILLLINNASQHQLGAVNGVAVSLGATARMVGPIFGGSILAWSETQTALPFFPFDYHLVFVVSGLMGLGCLALGLSLPLSLNLRIENVLAQRVASSDTSEGAEEDEVERGLAFEALQAP